MTVQQPNNNVEERKTRIILTGVSVGAVFGLISSYLYARAAAENDDPKAGTTESISTGQMLTLLLAVLGIIRQIAELGKPDKPKK
jgi:hypothetical protein